MPLPPPRRPHVALLGALVTLGLLLGACGAPSLDEGPGAATSFREELVIPAGDLDLAATLHLPAAEPPFPGLALVHGSGPLPRQGPVVGQLGLTFPSAIPIYEELAVALAERGYAVLVWDKRTCGPFNRCGDNEYPEPDEDLTVDAFRADAAAALEVLADLEEITDVVVLGHSQGGTLAAQLAVEHEAVDAAVLLTTPAVTIDRVLDAQADKLAELGATAGQPGASVDEPVAELRAIAAEVTAIGDGAVGGEDVGGASRRFWASWMDAGQDASDRLPDAEVPVLVLGGGADWNLPPALVEPWREHLPAQGELEILPELTHALTRLDEQDLTRMEPEDIGLELDPRVPERITAWLEEALDGAG
ncbi:MAG: alpha/beta hydrolase [Nitriliruptoraceae bacterium]